MRRQTSEWQFGRVGFPFVGTLLPRRGLTAVALLIMVLALGADRALALEARAVVDRNAITVDDVLGLTVVVTDGDGAVDTAPILDFHVADRGRSSSVQIVNASVTREVRYRFALTPLRTGVLVVPALTVGEGRKAATTAPITVQVSGRSTGTVAVSEVAVEAEVSESNPFLGQEIVYTFRLLAATQIADARYQAPEFDGFTATPLEDQRRYRTVRNGRELSVTELTYLLVPLRSGKLEIGAARLSCQVPSSHGATRRRDPFGVLNAPFSRRVPMREKSLRTQPVSVHVSALPAPPGGTEFTGLVGKFTLSAAVAPSGVTTGESATVTLVLEGDGNVAEASTPELRVPKSFKVYPEDPEAEVSRTPSGSRGSKRFRFALVPTESGEFDLGPFEVLSFDVATGGYRLLRAGPLRITVRPGDEPPPVVMTAIPSDTERLEFQPRREVVRRGHDILALYTGLDAIAEPRMLPGWLLWGAGAAPVLLYAGVWAVTARSRRQRSTAEQMARRARKELARARSRSGEEQLGGLRRSLLAAVLAVAGSTGEGLTEDEVREHLARAGVDLAVQGRVVELLEQLDAARFGGGTPPGAELVRAAEQAVGSLLREVRW